MKIDTDKLEKIVDHATDCCKNCKSSDCGYSCVNKAIIEACGKRVPKNDFRK